jgi:S-formylglutathione hydrolase FrmB
MPKTSRILVVAALIATALVGLPARATALEVVSDTPLSDRLHEIVVDSPAMERHTTLRVLLPTGYDDTADILYPVLYLLHGCCDDYRSWSDKTDLESFTAEMDLIVVMPDAGNGGMYTDWFNNGAGGPPRWETYHITELIPWVEQTYDVRAKRNGRLLAGLSMGGMGSFGYAARHPDLFVSAAAYSPYIDTNIPMQSGAGGAATDALAMLDGGLPGSVWGPRATEEIRWRAHNPWDLAENLGTLDLWIRTGDGTSAGNSSFDPIEYGVHQMAVSVHDRLSALGIDHYFEDYGHGGHTWDKWQAGLHLTLPQQLAYAATDPASPREFTYRTYQASFSVFDWSVDIERDVLEFARLETIEDGFTLAGSGDANVVSAPWFTPNASYTVTIDGDASTVTADDGGRLHLEVSLGSPRLIQQYRVPADEAYLHTATVEIQPV